MSKKHERFLWNDDDVVKLGNRPLTDEDKRLAEEMDRTRKEKVKNQLKRKG